jgi:hypothetical protein
MAKKIEVDIAYLKSIGLSQNQISKIINDCEPEHWTNKLPQDDSCFELNPILIEPLEKHSPSGFSRYFQQAKDPAFSFFNIEDAEFVQKKCQLLIEMSNFSFAVNESWSPDWNNKDEKKYGIVLQNGQARVSENELFNLYVFGIVTKSRSLALEMLEEFKNRVETYFNKPFNSVSERISIREQIVNGFGIPNLTTESNTIRESLIRPTFETDESFADKFNPMRHDLSFKGGLILDEQIDLENINNENQNSNPDFIRSFTKKNENTSTRKKMKFLNDEDIPKIQEALLKNVLQKDIAKQFDYSQGTISRVKEKLGFAMRKKYPTE